MLPIRAVGGDGRETHERNRRSENAARHARPAREHCPVDGRRADIQFVDLHQAIRTGDAFDGRIPRHGPFAYAGGVERHAHQLADAGHDRFLDDSLLLRRRRTTAARHLVGQRHGRRPGRCGHAGDQTRRYAGLRAAIHPGHRVILDDGRIPASHLRQRPLADLHARGIFVVPQRIFLPEPRQEGKHLRRRAQHHRFVLSPRKARRRSFPRLPPVAGGLLQHGQRRPVRPERLADRLEARAGAHDDRLRRSEEIHQRTARTHAAQRAVVGSPAPELESRGQGRIHLQLVRLRLRQRRGQRETGIHDQLPELVPHALRLGRRGILHRPQMALHGTGRPAPAFRHEQRPQDHLAGHEPKDRRVRPRAHGAFGQHHGQMDAHRTAGAVRHAARRDVRRAVDAAHPGVLCGLPDLETRDDPGKKPPYRATTVIPRSTTSTSSRAGTPTSCRNRGSRTTAGYRLP